MDGKGTTCMLEEKPKYLKFLTRAILSNCQEQESYAIYGMSHHDSLVVLPPKKNEDIRYEQLGEN